MTDWGNPREIYSERIYHGENKVEKPSDISDTYIGRPATMVGTDVFLDGTESGIGHVLPKIEGWTVRIREGILVYFGPTEYAGGIPDSIKDRNKEDA